MVYHADSRKGKGVTGGKKKKKVPSLRLWTRTCLTYPSWDAEAIKLSFKVCIGSIAMIE